MNIRANLSLVLLFLVAVPFLGSAFGYPREKTCGFGDDEPSNKMGAAGYFFVNQKGECERRPGDVYVRSTSSIVDPKLSEWFAGIDASLVNPKCSSLSKLNDNKMGPLCFMYEDGTQDKKCANGIWQRVCSEDLKKENNEAVACNRSGVDFVVCNGVQYKKVGGISGAAFNQGEHMELESPALKYLKRENGSGK